MPRGAASPSAACAATAWSRSRAGEGSSEISEDERQALAETEVQKLTDQYVKQVDDALADKEKDIRQV